MCRYTFDHLAEVIRDFTTTIGLTRYAIYVFDYGAPVDFCLAVSRPDKPLGMLQITTSRSTRRLLPSSVLEPMWLKHSVTAASCRSKLEASYLESRQCEGCATSIVLAVCSAMPLNMKVMSKFSEMSWTAFSVRIRHHEIRQVGHGVIGHERGESVGASLSLALGCGEGLRVRSAYSNSG